MIGDRLLEWMTHLGSGPWDAFREAVDDLDDGESGDDAQKLHRALRIVFSDLGHADFFVNGSRRWRVRRPALAELIGCGARHMFIGGRNARASRQSEAHRGREGRSVHDYSRGGVRPVAGQHRGGSALSARGRRETRNPIPAEGRAEAGGAATVDQKDSGRSRAGRGTD